MTSAVDVSRNQRDGFQFEFTGDIEAASIMLTLRTDTPMGIQGSLAFLTPDGIQAIPFHQTEDGFAIHDLEPLE